jgi:transposase
MSWKPCMAVLYGLRLSAGSVSAIQRQVSAAPTAPVDEARRFVCQQKAQYVDETSWREAGRQKWLWVNATRDVTAFHLLDGRSAGDARQVIDQSAKGVVATDRYWSYNWLPHRRRQVCWAHLARDFQAMAERGGESEQFGEGLLKQVRRLFTLWHKVRDGDLCRAQFQAAVKPVRRKVKELLEADARAGHKKTRNTCKNILKVGRSLRAFARAEGVEPTNNAAERALRRAVLWRKKSFGTQSAKGSRFVARVMTAVTTLRQQSRDVLAYLTDACRVALGDEVLRRLVPDPSWETR